MHKSYFMLDLTMANVDKKKHVIINVWSSLQITTTPKKTKRKNFKRNMYKNLLHVISFSTYYK